MVDIELKIKSRDIETLIDAIKKNVLNPDIELVRKAYLFAEESHKKQQRLSGEPYIIHPLEVAIILANMGMDTSTITAALLHDVVEDTENTLEEIEKLFGKDVALLVDGVTKISSLKKQSKSSEQAFNLRKMLLATIKDMRVILIKLADKLHNMRTIMFQPEHKQIEIAQEVLDIYAPLAGRLGISKIRSELEDLAFHCLNHEEYHEIANKVAQHKYKLDEFIDSVRNVLQKKFNELRIHAEITGRVKHYYSIFRKMKNQNKTIDEIFDIRAIRIITKEIRDCYGVLGVVHTLWTPITSRFKDYIAVPKSNMYQSLHTTVIGPDNHPLEIQIRTREMHRTAENGIAAHWAYKEKEAAKEYRQLTILKNIDKLEKEHDSREFIKELKMDLYEDEIYVFTPKGKIVKLAQGSTPVDFAYAIHSEVGSHCVGAKVNNALVPLRTELKSGDIVEILTSAKGHPSESWLKFVKSANARYKIRSYLRKVQETEKDKEKQGRTELPKATKSIEVSVPEKDLIKIRKVAKKNKIGISVEGTSNVLIRLSQCCQPIPGDDVVGFITRGRGIAVHKKNCPSLRRMHIEKERFIDIRWEEDSNNATYPVKIKVLGDDRPNLLKDIAEEISICKSNIIKVEAQVINGNQAEFKMILEVRNTDHLSEIMKHLKKIKNITEVFKLSEKVVRK